MDVEKVLEGLSNEELEELAEAIRFKRAEIAEREIRQTIEEHKEYIGKCYKRTSKDNTQYIKLVCAESENEYWMEALQFESPIKKTFIPIYHKKYFPGDGNFGKIEYKGINIDSIAWFTLLNKSDYKEITLEEFNSALDQHVEQLKDINWNA